jgi:hypothetical protein
MVITDFGTAIWPGFEVCITPTSAPTIVSVTPNSGFVGDRIRIVGTNFNKYNGTQLWFGSGATKYNYIEATDIKISGASVGYLNGWTVIDCVVPNAPTGSVNILVGTDISGVGPNYYDGKFLWTGFTVSSELGDSLQSAITYSNSAYFNVDSDIVLAPSKAIYSDTGFITKSGATQVTGLTQNFVIGGRTYYFTNGLLVEIS